MALKGKIKRTLLPEEYPQLAMMLRKERVVYHFEGDTFGAVDENSIAVSLEPDSSEYFIVPQDAVEWEDG